MNHIREAQAVVNVANETWSAHPSFLGVLDLLEHKLARIESLTRCIVEETGPKRIVNLKKKGR